MNAWDACPLFWFFVFFWRRGLTSARLAAGTMVDSSEDQGRGGGRSDKRSDPPS